MFGWVKRLWSVAANKVESWLDKIENPKAALDQVIRDMNTDIQDARVALGKTQVQLRKSKLDLKKHEKQAMDFRVFAEKSLLDGDEKRARQMLKRQKEEEKFVDHFRLTCENLESEIERLGETIQYKETLYQEAKSTKMSLLAQRTAQEHLAKLNKVGSGYTGGSNAFSEYERICEKIAEQSSEMEALSYIPSDLGGIGGDAVLLDSAIDSEMDELKKRLGVNEVPKLEDKSEYDGFDFSNKNK